MKDWFARISIALATALLAGQAGCGGGKSAEDDNSVSNEKSRQGEEDPASSSRETPPPATADGPVDLVTERLAKDLATQATEIDPRRSQWDGEVFGEAAEAQFKLIGKALEHADEAHLRDGSSAAATRFACGHLRPPSLVTAWECGQAKLLKADTATKSEDEAAAFSGRTGLAEALGKLAAPFQSARETHVKFKLIQVDQDGGEARTTSYYEAGGLADEGAVQQRAIWHCRWQVAGDSSPPLLLSIQIEDFREVHTSQPGGAWFVDCTQSALAGAQDALSQVSRGMNQWARELPQQMYVSMDMRFGLAVGDANGDGVDDLYVCQPTGIPNRLLVRDEQGALVDRSAEAGVDFLDFTPCALFVDLDNDADQDLVLVVYHHLLLLENDGLGHFTRRKELFIEDFDVQSVCAADFDQDHDLDLYACVYRATSPQGEFKYHDARNGGRNVLFRNDSTAENPWTFTDAGKECGLDDVDNNQRLSFAAAWEDYDNDGDQDLYVANDFGPNALYRNEGGKFVNVAAEAGVQDLASGMSVSWADYNHDGLMDLYVGNMFSSAGTRITHESRKFSQVSEDLREVYQRFAKGNSLFQNLGGGKFQETGAAAGVELGRWAWSSLFVDFNNDSWDDIFVTNGFITNDDPGDL